MVTWSRGCPLHILSSLLVPNVFADYGIIGLYEMSVDVICWIWGLKTYLTIKRHIGMRIHFVGDFMEVDTEEGSRICRLARHHVCHLHC